MKFAKICFFITLLFTSIKLQSQSDQSKTYFDRLGKASSESQAYYYRVKTEKQNEYKSYYLNGGNIFFEGKILKPNETDDNANVYTESCIWYYRNGKKKAIRNFNKEGLENGISNYYYESGKIWKEIEYRNGKIVENLFKEYDEDGKISKTFEEYFTDNNNDWDLYTSDKTSAKIEKGALTLTSFTKEGAARYINLPSISSEDFIIDASVSIAKLSAFDKAGIIYGFKDWQNYNFFLISSTNFYVGTIYEGVSVIKANGMFSSDIKKNEPNIIKIMEKNVYKINGSIQYTTEKTKNREAILV